MQQERARVARELHDIVTHAVTVMILQASAARRLIGVDAERAEIALGAVEEAGTRAINELRKMLGVPRGKLKEFSHFRQKVLIPAVNEVNAFSPYMVQFDAIRHGKKVIKLRLIWFAKDEQGLKAAYCEVQRHKAGRKARIGGLAEVIAGPLRCPDTT